jgi:hypothetical protein
MNLMMHIGINEKVETVQAIMEKNDLKRYLTSEEKQILDDGDSNLSERSKINLYWYIESTWALMWVLSFTNNFDIFKPADTNHMSNIFSKNLKANLRANEVIYKMLDLYYRLHWLCVNESLKTGNSPYIPDINLSTGKTIYGSLIMERRKALTWVMHSGMDWDHVDMNT